MHTRGKEDAARRKNESSREEEMNANAWKYRKHYKDHYTHLLFFRSILCDTLLLRGVQGRGRRNAFNILATWVRHLVITKVLGVLLQRSHAREYPLLHSRLALLRRTPFGPVIVRAQSAIMGWLAEEKINRSERENLRKVKRARAASHFHLIHT